MIRIQVEGQLADPAGVIPPAMRSAVTEAVLLLEREVKLRTPIGVTEAARGSIAGEVRLGLTAGLGNAVGTVGSPLRHVAVINDGRRPGAKMPPPDALELWVRRKIRGTAPGGGIRPLTVAEARSIAFLIARSIGRRGIKGRKFFEEAVQQNEGTLRGIFERAGLKISVRIAEGN